MSRSQWGAHKMVAGGLAASERVHQRCLEAVRRFGSATTIGEFNAVIRWMAQYDWFLRTIEDGEKVDAAHEAARARFEKRP